MPAPSGLGDIDDHFEDAFATPDCSKLLYHDLLHDLLFASCDHAYCPGNAPSDIEPLPRRQTRHAAARTALFASASRNTARESTHISTPTTTRTTSSTTLFSKMAEDRQPPVTEGATTGDLEDAIPVAKSAEDRKAQEALNSLDTRVDDNGAKNVDADAVKKAMDRLAGGTVASKQSNGEVKAVEKRVVAKVKVEGEDVKLLMDELDLNKIKATELLKQNEGSVAQAVRAFIAV